MGKRPLNPEGGRAEKIYARCPNGTGDRIAHLAARRGLSRSTYIREVVLEAIQADEAQEVAQEAS